MDHLFGGSALAPVDGDGRVRLPRFVRETAVRRSEDRTLVLGPHEADPCLTGYDRPYRRMLFADTERLRLTGEAGPAEAPRRARRTFGLTEEAPWAQDGTIRLPAMVRRMGRIEGLALFVGTGGAFEIWNPDLAATSGDPALAELARWRLGHDHDTQEEE
ncbi:MAG TPA: division/cell wall cluster transcriptional repressor MraZ [Allosphingosinicella sp.]